MITHWDLLREDLLAERVGHEDLRRHREVFRRRDLRCETQRRPLECSLTSPGEKALRQEWAVPKNISCDEKNNAREYFSVGF